MSFVLLPLLAQLHSILGGCLFVASAVDFGVLLLRARLWPPSYANDLSWVPIPHPADRLAWVRFITNRTTWAFFAGWLLTGPLDRLLACSFVLLFGIVCYFAMPTIVDRGETNDDGQRIANLTWSYEHIGASIVLTIVGILAAFRVYG
jgi:hypothetical protein